MKDKKNAHIGPENVFSFAMIFNYSLYNEI